MIFLDESVRGWEQYPECIPSGTYDCGDARVQRLRLDQEAWRLFSLQDRVEVWENIGNDQGESFIPIEIWFMWNVNSK